MQYIYLFIYLLYSYYSNRPVNLTAHDYEGKKMINAISIPEIS